MPGLIQGILSGATGNHAVWDSGHNSASITLSSGNLVYTSNVAEGYTTATLGKSSGKWYWEIIVNVASSTAFYHMGVVDNPALNGNITRISTISKFAAYRIPGQNYCILKNTSGSIVTQGTCTSPGANLIPGNICSFALDMDAAIPKLKFYVNGIQRGGDIFLTAGTWYPACCADAALGKGTANFGQNVWSTNPTVTATRDALFLAGYNPGVYII